jgi:hypothetical protein
MSVIGPTQKAGGSLLATINIVYDAESQSGARLFDVIMNKRPQDQPIEIWKSYWYRGAYLDPIQMLKGVIDNVSIRVQGDEKATITITAINSGNRVGVTPHIRLRPPLINYFTPKGSVIDWNDGKWEVK